MLYELRIYRPMPGKLPALLQRFEKATLDIWKKHGIRQAGFWTTVIGESSQQLTYMLAWEFARRAREEVACFRQRSAMACRPRRQRTRRPAGREF